MFKQRGLACFKKEGVRARQERGGEKTEGLLYPQGNYGMYMKWLKPSLTKQVKYFALF